MIKLMSKFKKSIEEIKNAFLMGQISKRVLNKILFGLLKCFH